MSIVAAARDAASRLLLKDTCSISRLGQATFNPATGEYEQAETAIYSGACHIAPYSGAGTLDEELGGEIVVTRNYRLTLPWDTLGIRKEDKVTMLTSEDPGLVGRQFRVDQVDGESFQTARRVVVESIDTTDDPEES